MPGKRCCEEDPFSSTPQHELAQASSDSKVAVRQPCCRRRGGGGGALVEPAALAALLVEGGHGYDLRRTICEQSGGELDIDVGGLYRSLRKLEEQGALTSVWSADETGPRRREYEVTQEGVELARQWLEALKQRQRLNDLLIGLLEDGLAASESELTGDDGDSVA